MIEVDVVEEALRGKFRSVPAVRHELRACADRRVVGSAEVAQAVRVRLDQQDVAVRADRRHHVQVDGLLRGPLHVSWRQRRRLALLVDPGHAPGTSARLARRQAVVGAVGGQIRYRLHVVEGIHHRHGLAGAPVRRRAHQVVCPLQIGGPVTGYGLIPGTAQQVRGIRADQRQALHLPGPGRDGADAADAAGQSRRSRRGQRPLPRQRSGRRGAMPGRAAGHRRRAPGRRGGASGRCRRGSRDSRQRDRGKAGRRDECSRPGPAAGPAQAAGSGQAVGPASADGRMIAVVPVQGSIPSVIHRAPRDRQGATR